MHELIDKYHSLKSKEDFIAFVELLLNDLRNNPNGWENNNLNSYLEAIANYTEDIDGYYENMNLPLPQNVDWKFFATILIGAKMYE